MTLLKSDAPLIRETAFTEHGRTLLIELYPRHVEMRFKGHAQALERKL
jgi:hypothetical protein